MGLLPKCPSMLKGFFAKRLLCIFLAVIILDTASLGWWLCALCILPMCHYIESVVYAYLNSSI